ncbi:DUF3152 domain-containing protein [Pseudonocardia sp. NPDC049635]|uniref:DUF3152 domain-containing protein n=1 Tax=Pseudonocardia sp. NPDC049635 TaxID=3155506 RepID=UPI0033E6718C
MPHLLRAGARPARTGTVALTVPAVLAVLTLLAGCGPGAVDDAPGPAPGPPLGEATAVPAPPAPAAPAAPSPPAGPAGPAEPARSEADVQAGVRSREVPRSASGETVVVPGGDAAPAGRARTVLMRVEIERGIDVDGITFAAFVTAVLDHPRSWGGDGSVGFARTDGAAPLRIVLATPELADRLCLPLDTVGRLSCRNGDRVVLNLERWVTGTPEYARDLTAYRRYLVNHEVGHWLGHGHEPCPGPGRPAPVMQQQTLGLRGCSLNPWPR